MNIGSWKRRAKQLKRETYALYLAYKDPRVPWYAKVFLALVVGYAFSPIDPIPDFIPVVGLLDEMVVVPLGVIVATKMIPGEVLDECRERARALEGKPVNKAAAVVVVCVWLLLAALGAFVALGIVQGFGVGA